MEDGGLSVVDIGTFCLLTKKYQDEIREAGVNDINDVVSTLKKYTRCIGVYEKGSIASIWSRTIESQIFSISENKFVDCDLLEFIEVRNE